MRRHWSLEKPRPLTDADGKVIPLGMVVHHRCFHKHCVNPAHLQLVTVGENSRLSNFEARFYETDRAEAA